MNDNDNSNNLYGDIDPFKWMQSSMGNALMSGVSYHQLWYATAMSSNFEEMDAAIDAAERLNLLTRKHRFGKR